MEIATLEKIKNTFIKPLTFLLLVVVLLYPFNQAYWHYGWDVNIPYADLIIIFVGIIWLVYLIISSFKNKRLGLNKQTYYNLIPLALLILAGGLSLFNVWPEQLLASFKYLWRFVIFYYIMYFILPQEIIQTKKQLWLVVKCFYILGIFLSIMGIVSFVWPEVSHSFRMATPLAWLGFFPYASSHNLLAEALVSITMFSWLLVYRYQNKNYGKFLYLGLVLMIGTVVLTFSRTGWLVLFIELLLLSLFYYRVNIKNWFKNYWWTLVLVLLAGVLYLFTLGQTYFVTSSNVARLAMIDRSWQLFLEHPMIGNGVGTWQSIVSSDIYYVYEFGQPLEQHGVVWKLIAEQGLLGLLIWLGIMIYFIVWSGRIFYKFSPDNHWRWVVLVGWLVIIGQFVFQLFDTGYYSAKMWLPLGMAFALVNIAKYNLNLAKTE